MTFPTFKDEVAFASDPFDDPQVWTEITGDTSQRSWGRGRQTEADTASTGTSLLGLVDDDRSYDPENAAGAYYPNVLPMRRSRSRATLDGGTTWYDVFNTFVDVEQGWGRDESEPGKANVSVPGNDAFDIFANSELSDSDSFPEQLTGERIGAILDAIGWPAALRDIDDGQETVQAIAAGDAATEALALIRDAEQTEPGYFFVDERGYACFHDRLRRISTPYTQSQATFCDANNYAAGRLLYARLATSQSKIRNDIKITASGLATQTAQDAASKAITGAWRSFSLSTLHTTVERALLAAKWWLSLWKTTYTRFDELELQPGTDSDIWEQVLARKIGDRITVIRTPPGGGAAQSKACHIEAVNVSVGPGVDARCIWRLSPADQTTYWNTNDGDLSVAGVTTRGAY